MLYYVADLAQLIHQLGNTPVSIVAHSLGGAISMRYSGVYPERVRRLAVIEGLGISPLDQKAETPVRDRWRAWITERRVFSGRTTRRYASLEDACVRMGQANPQLSQERIHHLTIHGISLYEDGTYSWKFDNYVRAPMPADLTDEEHHTLWRNIDCPVWLVHGANSWARHPGLDGRAGYFRQAHVTSYEDAGHWAHHDCFESFLTDLKAFL